MRTGKRNWLLILVVVCSGVFLLGSLSNRQSDTAVAAVDTRTAMEKFVSAYSQYTQAQIDRFEQYQAVLRQDDSNVFWNSLLRYIVVGAVSLAMYFGFRFIPIVSDRARVVKTDRGHVWIGRGADGEFIARVLDAPFQQPASEKKPSDSFTITKGNQTIEVDRGGNVVDVVDDPVDFLEKAIRVNGPRSKELPSHEKMNVSGERWSKIVNEVLGGAFDVKPGRKTFCAQYPDLQATYYAVKRGEIAPLPAKKRSK